MQILVSYDSLSAISKALLQYVHKKKISRFHCEVLPYTVQGCMIKCSCKWKENVLVGKKKKNTYRLILHEMCLKGLIHKSCDILGSPLGELPASDLTFLHCHRCLLMQHCPWNAVTTSCLTSQHVPTAETDRWKKTDLCWHFLLKPVI